MVYGVCCNYLGSMWQWFREYVAVVWRVCYNYVGSILQWFRKYFIVI